MVQHVVLPSHSSRILVSIQSSRLLSVFVLVSAWVSSRYFGILLPPKCTGVPSRVYFHLTPSVPNIGSAFTTTLIRIKCSWMSASFIYFSVVHCLRISISSNQAFLRWRREGVFTTIIFLKIQAKHYQNLAELRPRFDPVQDGQSSIINKTANIFWILD